MTIKTRKTIRFSRVIEGVLKAYILTLILFVIFSLILYFTKISEETIPAVIFIVSILSIFLSSVGTAKKVDAKGWMYGGLIGVFYVLICSILGSIILSGSVNLGKGIILNLFIGLLVGAFSGALGINL